MRLIRVVAFAAALPCVALPRHALAAEASPSVSRTAPKPDDDATMQNMPGMDDQGTENQDMQMPGMDTPSASPEQPAPAASEATPAAMPGMSDMMGEGLLGHYPMTRDASGTSWQPDSASHHGLHATAGDWMLMGHMTLWGIYDTQSGRRGDDKFFAAGMLMGAARRDFPNGDVLNLRAMLSPEPFMGRSGYPLLLATGETANGTSPLVDRQHPHDLFMELSATYRHDVSDGNSLFLYSGYPGEPALGPPAFMHRVSGADIPDAPITHHWLDSTHIVFGVVTAGLVHDNWKFEVSQFTGREPDQNRFDFDTPKFDSTSLRVSWNPASHWSLQTSWGHLHSPEQLDPSINEDRYTASAIYAADLGEGASVSATLAWGLKHLSNGENLNGAMLEGEFKPSEPWTAFARLEWEQNSELSPSGQVSKVAQFSLGGIHDWRVSEHAKLGLGALYAFDVVPTSLKTAYGSNPHGAMVFVRLAAE